MEGETKFSSEHEAKQEQHRSEEKDNPAARPHIDEVLPKSGLLFSECGSMNERFCKPKILPIKGATVKSSNVPNLS